MKKFLKPKRSSSLQDKSQASDLDVSSSSLKDKDAILSPKRGLSSRSPKASITSRSPKASITRLLSPSPKPSSQQGSRSLNPEDVKEYEQVFKLIDTDGDGRISLIELGSMLKSLGDPHSDEELLELLKEIDSEGDGFISLEKFIRVNARAAASSDELRAAFQVFDIDRNGYISPDELHKVLIGLGNKGLTEEECGKMIKGVDLDGNGSVDFEEFKAMMARREIPF